MLAILHTSYSTTHFWVNNLALSPGTGAEDNPYQNIQGEKGHKLNLSGGLGYRNKGFFVDLTYVHSMNKDVHFAYRLSNSPYSGASIKETRGNVLLTVGFKI